MAEALRSLPGYKGRRRLFVGPTPRLKQLRINTLLDGKELLMPSPGLRDGFYLFRPFTIPFVKLPLAVTHKGMPHFARKLTTGQLAGLGVDLLVDEVLAVDRHGRVLGDGQGYFDLSLAILAATGALAGDYQVVAVAAPLEPGLTLPADPWDLQADYLLNGQGLERYPRAQGESPPKIFWEQLSPTRIKRITPLWQLRNPQPLL
ncbi:5-formyltetrahydrofolate cyclo-ligase [Desulfurivibrio sp. D14AmB]|uniref:5-formyltetrahydrofolate cyclo-ligase n=1 Tax=Desulfurivibrio sp. D14AmB TaxID=3374370 RepID=UPI00376F1E47